jgi:hypothetical protein
MWQAPSVEEMQAMLPQYEILEILGRGGMGAVYKGRQKSLKRLVAIKILPPDAADDEMRFVERFENEAQTMAAMNHPAIVSVYDFGETAEGLLYFIMEFVDGTDVHKMIQTSGKLGDDYALAITAHVCDALDYAHSRGVIHRDIKPANILIDQEGRVKVADFGLAKMHDPSMTSGLTRTNMAMGTPDYVAPESLSMGMVVDHRADLYAVGVMLYQMLTGEVPRGMFRMPSEKGIGTDPRFDEIICKAMESDRDHRYQTASEVRHALDVILTTPQPKNDGTGVVPLEAIPRKVVLNVPGGPIGQSAVVPSRSQAAPPKKEAGKAVVAKGAPAKGPASPSGKSSTGLWVTVGGVVAALGVAGFFVMGSKPEPEPVAKVQPAPASPVDAAFLAQVAAAPAARQVELVKQKIEALNGTTVKVEPTIKGEKVTGLRMIKADASVPDISPIAALKDLDSLQLEYLTVRDISCLRGLKLVNLTIWDGRFTDVSVLQSFPLQTFSLKQSLISDFSVLNGKALQRLDLEWCQNLSDLSFVKGMPVKYLNLTKTKVRDFSPIAGLPLVELTCDPEAKLDPALIASIPTLKKINTKPVSEWPSVAGNAPPSATTGRTIDLLALVDVKRDTIAGEWVRTAEGIAKQGPGTTDKGAPRLQLPYEPPEEYDFEVEFTAVADNQSVGQMLSTRSRVFSWILAGNTREAPTAGFELFDNEPTSRPSEVVAPMEENLKAGRRYLSRVEVRAGSVRGFLDGVKLVDWEGDFNRLTPGTTGNLRDDKHLGLRAARNVIFHKITVREITGTGKVDAGVSASTSPPASVMPPSIANWQDVTESVREKARSKPDLLVEPDVVRRERGNQHLGVPLTEVLKPSLALRVIYMGEAQISLWFEKSLKTESAYVLARQTETIFNRVDTGNNTLPLLPPVPHPADFDDSVPHELLLTLQNSVLRVWIDGRFVGEGQDDSFKQAGMTLIFTKQSAVSKVELAELDETVGAAKTPTKLDEAFIRAVATAAPQEEQVSLVTAKLSEINGAEAILVPTIMGGKVKYLRVERKGDALLLDISPLAALKDLTDLRLMYVGPADISCLVGLPLERLEIHGGSFEDLSVLPSMPLRFLGLHSLSPSSQEALDFTILRGMKLGMLHLSSKRLEDISFIKGMPLKDLSLTGSAVRDFSPIAGMPLIHLEFAPEAKPDMALLRSIPTLKTINKRPAAEYLKTPDGASATWTDWLTPKLASGTFDGGQWKREAEGFTTEKSLAGYEVLPAVTRDGAIKVTFAMRDSQGVMINIRETKVGTVQQRYTAQYTGTSLYLAHGTNRLASEPMQGELRDLPEHTLEFRFEGENLIAILNDTHRISTRHSQLTEGRCAVVLTQGVVVKKIEVQTPTPAR